MLKGAVARRYAEAVMEIATQPGTPPETLDRWLADVKVIGEAFGDRHLAFVLREPKIPEQRKELVVRDLLAPKVQREALNLALVLVRDNLVEVGPRLAVEFERLYNDYRGQAVALVTSAMPLDDAERAQVAGQLRAVTGKRILLRERVDPAILGGVVARVGDTLIDGSVRRRLLLLRDQIIKGGGNFGGPSDGRPAPTGGGGSDGGVPPSTSGGAPGSGGAPFVVGSDSGATPPAPPAPPATGSAGSGGGDGGPASVSMPERRASASFSTSAGGQPRRNGPPNRRANNRNRGRRR